jgi:hypothetical protein
MIHSKAIMITENSIHRKRTCPIEIMSISVDTGNSNQNKLKYTYTKLEIIPTTNILVMNHTTIEIMYDLPLQKV